MTNEDPSPGQEGYWESVGDRDVSTIDLVEECLDDLEEPEDLLGAILAGEDDVDDLRYVLCATRKVRDGNMLLTLRYVTVDIEDVEARTGKNRIRLRVQGSLLQALPPLFASIKNGDCDPDDPMVFDALNPDGVDHTGRALTRPLYESESDETESESDVDGEPDEATSGRTRGARDSADRYAGARRDTESCIECGLPVKKSEGINLGGALGSDEWVHEGPCPDDGDEDDEETDGDR